MRRAWSSFARAVGSEPERWLISTNNWRSAADERRYLRALRRHPHAEVFVAEAAGRLVGRLSIARDPHPASLHVADLGLMFADYRRRGVGRDSSRPPPSGRTGRACATRLRMFPHNDAAIRLYEAFGFVRGLPPRPLLPRRRVRRRDPDGEGAEPALLGNAILRERVSVAASPAQRGRKFPQRSLERHRHPG